MVIEIEHDRIIIHSKKKHHLLTQMGQGRRKHNLRPFFFMLFLIWSTIATIKSTFAKNHTTTSKPNLKNENDAVPVSKEHNLFVTFPPISEETNGTKEEYFQENKTKSQEEEDVECEGRRPAIEQFPKPLMSQNVRSHGGVLFYILVTAYTFLAVAITCDEFFVPSLEILCEVLKISPDVAGATFMAAGSSAPELATALIGVFVAHDDIGVSGVIGSAVFNIMFVISLCGLLTTQVLHLNWWPLVRDCFFYMVSILALLGTIADESIEWYESIILLLLYVVYCYVMYWNDLLEAWAHTLPVPFPVHVPQVVNEEQQLQHDKENVVSYKAVPTLTEHNTELDNSETSENGENTVKNACKLPFTSKEKSETIIAHFEAPSQGKWKKFLWGISLPLIYLLYYTIPDCRMEKWRNWYIVTFSLSMIWIAIFSYFMVWTITVTGFTLGIPDTVMGLTFVAAGVSVPDALSSLAVLKDGQGDMAVSNAVGSNVFDILVCLGLPWFLSTVIIHPGESVRVFSKGLVYSTFSLLSTVAFLLFASHYNGWKLDRRYGIILMLWYLLFMIFASLYELNVFAEFNPRECPSDY